MIDRLRGGRADRMRAKDFDPSALRNGTEHELEHTDDRALAQEIAMDHLAEDPRYYEKLERMERGYQPNRRRYVQTVPTEDEAREIRETFMARSAKHRRTFSWVWPPDLLLIGRCLAVMYSSDKWKAEKDFEDYKHIAEAPQQFLIAPDVDIRIMGTRGRRELESVSVSLIEPMPSDFAKLAPLLGVQVQLFQSVDSRGRGKLGRGKEDLFELAPSRAYLGGARHPKTGQAFLVIYNASRGVIALVTGNQLDIEKDGVVG
jgi:hypothetical protein